MVDTEEKEMNSNQEIVKSLTDILLEMRELKNIFSFHLLCENNRISKYVESIIGNSKRRANVYLETDGEKTATEIGSVLGMQRPNVSMEHKVLLDAGLIQKDGSKYRKSSIQEIVAFAGLLLAQEQKKLDENLTASSNSEVEEKSGNAKPEVSIDLSEEGV